MPNIFRAQKRTYEEEWPSILIFRINSIKRYLPRCGCRIISIVPSESRFFRLHGRESLIVKPKVLLYVSFRLAEKAARVTYRKRHEPKFLNDITCFFLYNFTKT